MNNTVKNVKAQIIFTFSNGEQYELPLVNKNVMEQNLSTYGTSIKLNEKLYESSSENIVGNICGNTLNIELTSKDKLLIPNNESSKYYGYMNDTAYIDINCTVKEDSTTIYMGRYFVNTWESGLSSSEVNNVSITAVDLMSKIKNMTLDKVRLKRNITFNEYLKTIIDSLNAKLPSSMQILYTEDDLNIYKNSNTNWQMYFNNIDRTSVESLFNSIAKYTISYIWVNRNMHMKTDHLLDDSIEESVSEISGAVNLFEYGNQSGDIDKYSGVKVSYITDIAYEDKEVLQLSNVQLLKGENVFNDQQLNSDKVYNIHTIEIKCEDGQAYVSTFNYFKNKIDITIEASTKTKATINVYGTVLNETYSTIEKYKDNNIKNTVIEIENRVLNKNLINTYVDGLVQLMSMKNNKVYAEGYINPQIQLGDTVYMQGKSMNIHNFYKVIGLNFTLGTNYRCEIELLRTIPVVPNVDDILAEQRDLLYDRLTGLVVTGDMLKDITNAENVICEDVLEPQLTELRAVLNGGA